MWSFPLAIYKCNLPINGHPGSFGSIRKHDIHTGIDLYCPENTPVLAVEKGQVVLINIFTGPKINSPWWHETSYVAIKGESGIVVYGEIDPSVQIGQNINQGDTIGFVQQVLKQNKGKPMTMLHLELYNKEIEPVIWDLNKPCPQGLLDPTDLLVNSLIKK